MRTLLVNIDVSDLSAAEKFYVSAWGARVSRRFGGFSELEGLPVPVYLLQARESEAPAPGARRNYARHWTPVHLDLVVEDFEAAVERALRAGAKMEGNMRSEAWGRIATFADPFGHGFCLLQFRGKGYGELPHHP